MTILYSYFFSTEIPSFILLYLKLLPLFISGFTDVPESGLFIFSGKKVNPACYSILAQSITLFSNTRFICPLSHWTLSSLKIGLCFIHLHIFTHNLQRFMECHRCWLPLPLLWLQYGVARVMHRTLIASQGWKKLQALCFIYDTWSLLIHP